MMMLLKKCCLLFVVVLVASTANAQSSNVTGIISDRDGNPLENVNVRILNSNKAFFTDRNGEYKLTGLSRGRLSIQYSAVGYATENQRIIIEENDLVLNVELTPSSTRLDEAIVTANKNEEDPQQIPASLSVVNAKQVEQQYIWNIMDATALVPNLNIANPGDNRNVTSIRGIATTSYNQAVATYVDGVNQFGLDTYIPYLQDVERIEVLRGPQGTLYGRNAMGGVINIVTKQPTNQVSGVAEAHLGNHGQQRYLLGIRSPIVKDKLFFGASGLFSKLDGFYTNDFDDSPYDEQYTAFGNYYLKYLPSDKWAMTLNFKHVSNRNRGAFPLVFGMESAFETPFHLNQNAKTKMVDESRNVSLSVNHFGRSVNFSSQTAFQSNHRYYQDPIDGDFSPADAISIINNYGKDWNMVKVFTQEFKLSSAAGLESQWHWTAGSYLFYQDSPAKQGTRYGADGAMMDAPTNALSILTNAGINKGVALFGQAGYRIVDGLDALVGLRYDYEHAEIQAKGEYQPDGSALMVTQPDTAATAEFNAITPSASLKYTWADDNHIYGSYSRGFRAGGISQLSSDPSHAPLRPFDPEFSNNFEVGSKNLFLDQRLQLNFSAFYTQVNNAQVPTLILPDAITITRNTGRMESRGMELEISSRVLPNLEIMGNGAFTHARYTDFNAASDDANVQLKGNRPVFTPEWTGFLGAQYKIPLGTANRQSIQLGVYGKFVGHQYYNVANTLEQGAYSLLNANIGYTVDTFELVFWGQNLADKRYADYAYDFGAVHLGRPITYGMTVRKRFGQGQ